MTTRRWTVAAAGLFAGYAATIAGANWASTLWPAVTVMDLQIPAGTLVAGLAFTARDLQDAVGTRTTLLAVTLGAALSGLVAEPRIALASAAPFAVYTPLRDRSRLAAVGLSNAIGLLVDSLVFLPLASCRWRPSGVGLVRACGPDRYSRRPVRPARAEKQLAAQPLIRAPSST